MWRASAGRRTFRDVAADLNVNPETLRTWVRDADGRPAPAGAPADAADELVRLRPENCSPSRTTPPLSARSPSRTRTTAPPTTGGAS
nr:transposase [Streptomyces ureilyticus]